MDYFSWKFLIWATSLAALRAVSLPVGSVVALRTNPRTRFSFILTAFGTRALITALSVEMVAPTVRSFYVIARKDLFSLKEEINGSNRRN